MVGFECSLVISLQYCRCLLFILFDLLGAALFSVASGVGMFTVDVNRLLVSCDSLLKCLGCGVL